MKKGLLSLVFAALGLSGAFAQTSDPCTAPVVGTINAITCADIGTANYAAQSVYDQLTPAIAGDNNSVSSGCGSTSNGQWYQYDLGTGVANLNYDPVVNSGSGTGNIYMEIFQGASCATLSSVGCHDLGLFDKGIFYGFNVVQNGLNSSQNMWLYISGDKGSHSTEGYLVGSAAATVPNESCGSATVQASTGCNLGAPKEIFNNADGDVYNDPNAAYATGPESYFANGTCGDPAHNTSAGPDGTFNECGGTSSWSSNENTVFFQVSATSTAATVEINNVVCNDGVSGAAQFAVAETCSCFTTNNYADCACFEGCYSGAGSLSLSLNAGQSYIIMVDGFAGDVCTWNFVYSGITLLSNTAISVDLVKKEYDAVVSWTTENLNATHFEIFRVNENSPEDFELVETVFAKEGVSSYSFTDKFVGHTNKRVLYKIVQHNKTGETITSPLRTVIFTNPDAPVVMYNPHSNEVEMSFYQREAGMYHYGIYDSMGRAIYSEEVALEKGGTKLSRKLDSESTGVYFVVIRNLETQEGFSHKFLK